MALASKLDLQVNRIGPRRITRMSRPLRSCYIRIALSLRGVSPPGQVVYAAQVAYAAKRRWRMGRSYVASVFLAGLLVLGGFVPRAVLAQPSWYLGASLGQSAIDAGSGEVEQGFLLDDAFVATGTTLDKSDTGGKAYFGRRFNRFLAAEAGYVDLGEASFNTTIIGAPPGTAPAPPFAIHATATAKGVFVAGLAHLPLTDSFSFFGKAGLLRSEAEFTERIAETGATRVSRTERNTEALFGLGVQAQFTPLIGGRIEWERFKNVGRGIGGREGRDVDYLSAGVLLQF